MGMHKIVKPQFGGGMRRFSCEEDNIYENIESELCFFTSQVRRQNCRIWELYVSVVVNILGCYEKFLQCRYKFKMCLSNSYKLLFLSMYL